MPPSIVAASDPIAVDPPKPQYRMILGASLSTAFILPFIASSVNVAVPSIETDFQANAVLLSWIPTSYILVAACLLIPMGKVSDMVGRRKIYRIGISIYALGALICLISPSIYFLLAGRGIQAVGSSMMLSNEISILVSSFPPEKRGTVLGLNVATVYGGLAAGPFLGGILSQYLGWRSVFGVAIPFCLVIFICLSRIRTEWRSPSQGGFDWVGVGIYLVALSGLLLGFSGLPSAQGFGLIGVGLAAAVGFVRWEIKVENPLLDIEIFRNRIFAFSSLASLISYAAAFSVSFLISLYLQYIQALSPQDAGLILVSQPILQMVFSPITGRLSDRMEPRLLASAGMVLIALGLLWFSFLQMDTPLPYVVMGLGLLGSGFALFSPPNVNATMGAVEKRYFSTASASVGTVRMIGQVLSIGVTTLVFAAVIGDEAISPETYPQLLTSIQRIFGFSCILCGAGVFLSLARGNLRSGEPLSRQA